MAVELTPDEWARVSTIPVHVAGHPERLSAEGQAALGALILAAYDHMRDVEQSETQPLRIGSRGFDARRHATASSTPMESK